MKIPSQRKVKKIKPLENVRSISDDYGNLVIARNNGKRIILSLKLVEEDRHRRIGVVNLAQKTLSIRRCRDKHLFRKATAYGINYKLLADSKLFDTVKISDELQDWSVPVSYILENGSFLNFQNVGFELQLFVSLEQIEQFKMQKNENRIF
jgi:hypothetical protein